MKPEDFIKLPVEGFAINPAAISVVDFRNPDVAVSVGANVIVVTGDDAEALREAFGMTEADRAEAAKKADKKTGQQTPKLPTHDKK